MADEADMAFEAEQLALAQALANCSGRYGSIPKLTPKGVCHYCDAKVKAQQLFCDSDCEKDWRKYILRQPGA